MEVSKEHLGSGRPGRKRAREEFGGEDDDHNDEGEDGGGSATPKGLLQSSPRSALGQGLLKRVQAAIMPQASPSSPGTGNTVVVEDEANPSLVATSSSQAHWNGAGCGPS